MAGKRYKINFEWTCQIEHRAFNHITKEQNIHDNQKTLNSNSNGKWRWVRMLRKIHVNELKQKRMVFVCGSVWVNGCCLWLFLGAGWEHSITQAMRSVDTMQLKEIKKKNERRVYLNAQYPILYYKQFKYWGLNIWRTDV